MGDPRKIFRRVRIARVRSVILPWIDAEKRRAVELENFDFAADLRGVEHVLECRVKEAIEEGVIDNDSGSVPTTNSADVVAPVDRTSTEALNVTAQQEEVHFYPPGEAALDIMLEAQSEAPQLVCKVELRSLIEEAHPNG